MQFIVFGGVLSLVLTVAKGLFPTQLSFLPLGGSSISELGIVLGLAVAAATLADLRKSKEKEDE